MRRITLCLAVVLATSTVLAACGDDDGIDPTISAAVPITATTAATGAVSTTESVTTLEAVTTTEAPTPTTTTEALPEDLHPVYGVSWAAYWPLPDGSTAVYEVDDGGGLFELPARYDHNVDFKGGSWDRFTLGVVEPNNEGLAMYFGSPEPWVVEFAGWEYHRPDGGYTLEWYPEPIRLELAGDMQDPLVSETVARLEFGGDVDDLGTTITYHMTGTMQDIEVPAGILEGFRFGVDVSGELMGGDFVFPVEVALAEGQWIAELINSPAHNRIALKEAWTG